MKFDYAGIGEVSDLLGLSRTSVQRLVDANELIAFKTAGGHRRVLRTSIEAFKKKMEVNLQAPDSAVTAIPVSGGLTRDFPVLVVEEDQAAAMVLVKSLTSRCPDAKIALATDWLDAVLCLGRMRPRILIMTLSLRPAEGIDGLAFLRMVATRQEYQSIPIVVSSDLSPAELAAKGGVPPNVLLFEKPLNLDRLEGFIDAHAQFYLPPPKRKLHWINGLWAD